MFSIFHYCAIESFLNVPIERIENYQIQQTLKISYGPQLQISQLW